MSGSSSECVQNLPVGVLPRVDCEIEPASLTVDENKRIVCVSEESHEIPGYKKYARHTQGEPFLVLEYAVRCIRLLNIHEHST